MTHQDKMLDILLQAVTISKRVVHDPSRKTNVRTMDTGLVDNKALADRGAQYGPPGVPVLLHIGDWKDQ